MSEYFLHLNFKYPYLLQAHEPLDTIHKLRITEETVTPAFQIQVWCPLVFDKMFLHFLVRGSISKILQVQLFLAKLTGQPIGLTALNMFVIDKPVILTVCHSCVSSTKNVLPILTIFKVYYFKT